MAIQFDYTNLLAEMVGEEHGVTLGEREEFAPRAEAAVASFRKLWEQGLYGFPDLPGDRGTATEIAAYAASVRGTYDTVCVVGIGGSALGAWAVDCFLRGPHPVQGAFSPSFPRLVILDNVDPTFVGSALASMTPRKTLVVVIAKSGSTAETIATFLIVKDWLEQALGKKAARRIVAVTSAGKGDLKTLATSEGYATFHIPENVGGRFSVLSSVGLVPAALTGVNIGKLLKGAAGMTKQCWEPGVEANPAAQASLFHYLTWKNKNKPIHVAFPYSNRLWGLAFWFRQLWAESLGKATTRAGETSHIGQTPVAALGTTDQHSQVQLYREGPNDKVYSFWAVKKFPEAGRIPKVKTGMEALDYLGGQTLAKLLDAERLSTAAALTEANRPNGTFVLDRLDEEHLGAFFQLLEFETAFMGELLDINAFDQEGVELGKRFTYGLMGRKGFSEYRQRLAEYEQRGAALRKA
jgi:glucose-6-phosphate isomerase